MSETTGFEHQSPNADTKADGQDACRSRTRLTKGEKLDVLKLRDAKIQVSEIARRLSCGERTVYDILKNKSALQEEAKSPGFNDARKSERPSRYPKVGRDRHGYVLLVPYELQTESALSCFQEMCSFHASSLVCFMESPCWSCTAAACYGIYSRRIMHQSTVLYR